MTGLEASAHGKAGIRSLNRVPSRMAIRAVVFDLFHTLVSFHEAQTPGPRTYEMAGMSCERWFDLFYREDEERITGKSIDIPARIQAACHKAGVECTREWAEEIERVRTDRFQYTLNQAPKDVVEDLGRLRAAGLRLGLLSDADLNECAGWDGCPLASCFDAARFSSHEELCKPDARFYRMVLKDLGVEPGESLFVGDGGSDELRGAAAVGMTPVLMTRHLAQEHPERIPERQPLVRYTVETVADLFAVIAAEDGR